MLRDQESGEAAGAEDPAGEVARLRARVAHLEAELAATQQAPLAQAHAELAELQTAYARLATIVANVDVSLALLDGGGRVQFANQSWLQRVGKPLAEVLGRRYDEFAPPGLVARPQALVDQVLATGEPVTSRDFVVRTEVHPEGVYVDGVMQPIREPGQGVTGVLSVSIDVTEKVLARRAVEAERALLQTVVEGVPVAVALYDHDLRVVQHNQEWASQQGQAGRDLRGQHASALLGDDAEMPALYRRVLAGGAETLLGVARRDPASGERRYYDLYFSPVAGAAGQPIGLLTTAIDVTARYEREREKDHFLTLVAHELKTPLTSIKAAAQLGPRVAGEGASPRLLRLLETIIRQVDQLNRLIGDLLDVSRMAGPGFDLQREVFDLGALVADVAQQWELTAPDFAVRVVLPAVPVLVHADRGRIGQVLGNLVENAIKYSASSRQVDVALRLDQETVRVSVRDYGVGIPADEQARVFDRYFRARNALRTHVTGLGVGLAISRQIVFLHGGEITVESDEGAGSTFSFALPLHR